MEAGVTPLQVYLAAFGDLLRDAREELDERAWPAFVSVACDIVGNEAAKVLLRELDDEREAAE
jgi:hypothetical protein